MWEDGMNTSTPRDWCLAMDPNVTCKKEGQLYVVRNGEGQIITARAGNYNAWQRAAITLKKRQSTQPRQSP
jgi:hypothetical protein